jgi:hypothetical protein
MPPEGSTGAHPRPPTHGFPPKPSASGPSDFPSSAPRHKGKQYTPSGPKQNPPPHTPHGAQDARSPPDTDFPPPAPHRPAHRHRTAQPTGRKNTVANGGTTTTATAGWASSTGRLPSGPLYLARRCGFVGSGRTMTTRSPARSGRPIRWAAARFDTSTRRSAHPDWVTTYVEEHAAPRSESAHLPSSSTTTIPSGK